MNIQKNSLPNLNCNIRFLNSASSSNLDIYLNKKLFIDGFSFGKVTSYRNIPSGEYYLSNVINLEIESASIGLIFIVFTVSIRV